VLCADDGNSDVHALVLSGAGRMQSQIGNHAEAIRLISQAKDICMELHGEFSDRYLHTHCCERDVRALLTIIPVFVFSVASELINLSNAYKAKGYCLLSHACGRIVEAYQLVC
jgi:hypothetical protein